MSDIEQLIRRRAGERGTLLLTLQEIQARQGYVPEAVIPLIAAEYGTAEAEVRGVLEFYPELRTSPPGRHRLCVCRGEACAAVGAGQLLRALELRYGMTPGMTDAEGKLTYDTVACLGNCALGPSAAIDGELHGRLTAAALVERVEEVNND